MDDYNNRPYRNPDDGKVKPKRFFQRNLMAVIIAGIAVVVVLALLGVLFVALLRPTAPSNVTGAHPTLTTVPPTPTATPIDTATPTDTPADTATPTQTSAPTAGTVLCQYDTTKGFNNWINSTQWKPISNGTLGSAGTDNGDNGSMYVAWSGCNQLPTANYAVEAQMQYVRSVNIYHDNYAFGIMLRGDGTSSGYEVGVGQDNCNSPTIALISLIQNGQSPNSSKCSTGGPAPLGGSGSSQDYKIDTNWHTYRAEITGNIIRLFIDGNRLLETSDNTFTDAGQVGLRDVYSDVNVKSFKVTSL